MRATTVICLLLLTGCGSRDNGKEPTIQTDSASGSARNTPEQNGRVSLEVELFRPSDLSLNVKDISEKMNTFRFTASVADDTCDADQNKDISGNLVESKELKFKIKRNCNYRLNLYYGFSPDPDSESPSLSEVFYETSEALNVSREYLLEHDPVEIKLLLKLTDAGREKGLVVQEIQGENYERGKKIPVVHRKTGEKTRDDKESSGESVSEEKNTGYSAIESLLLEGAGNCVSCHSPEAGIFPDLTGKENAEKYAERILVRSEAGTMPPEASRAEGKTRTLNAEEIKLLRSWVESESN